MNRRKATVAQLTYLSKHIKQNLDMASGHTSQTLQERADLEKQWQELANKLNSLGGSIKTTTKWKQAWRDLKNNVKKKVSQNRSEFQDYDTGSASNSPTTVNPMSSEDDQVLSVIDPVAVFEMEGVSITEPIVQVSVSPILSQSNTDQPLQQNTNTTIPSVSLKDVPLKTAAGASRPRKRKRIAIKEDNFDMKLLKLEEQNLIIKKERNAIEEKKTSIAQEKNLLLNRIADLLQKILENKCTNK